VQNYILLYIFIKAHVPSDNKKIPIFRASLVERDYRLEIGYMYGIMECRRMQGLAWPVLPCSWGEECISAQKALIPSDKECAGITDW
jgi:hypothetical protein